MHILVFAGASALAASPVVAVVDDQPNSVIVTGTRLPVGAREVQQRPGGADLVTADEYRDRAAVSLRDALLYSPGVYAQPRFGQEIRLSIRGSGISRGFHMRGLTLLQDGIPINLGDDNGDFQELDPSVLQHLEVYRGANAFRFGGTTLGGAINGVTPTGRTSRGVNLRADGGSFSTLRGRASYGYADDRLDGWLAVTGDRSDGDRDHDRRRSLRFHSNLGLALGSAVETRFYASAQTIDQELPGALTYDIARTRPRTGNFAGDQQRNIDSIRVQNRTSAQLGDVAIEGGLFLNAKRLIHPIYQVIDQRSLDKGLFGRIGYERGPLELLLGATARFGTVDSERFVNIAGDKGAPTFDADLTARTIDTYGEARLRVGDVRLIAGGIYTLGRRTQEQSFPLVTRGSASFDQFSPRLGLTWDAATGVEVYANLSRSHELPGFIELAQVASFVPLDAQHAWTGEVGTRATVGHAKLDLSLYRARVRNELLQFTVGPDIPASTFNAGRTLHQGIEAGLEWAFSDTLSLRQSYQFNDFRFDGDAQYGGNRLPVVPRHLLRSELRFGPKGWHVAPSVEWVPQGAYVDYANSFRAAGYATLGVNAAAQVGRGLEVFVDARNLTAKKAVGDISAVVAYSGQSIFYPVERRALYAGVRAGF